jgi:hypothetical protein
VLDSAANGDDPQSPKSKRESVFIDPSDLRMIDVAFSPFDTPLQRRMKSIRRACRHLNISTKFQAFMSCIIVLNVLMIGHESAVTLDPNADASMFFYTENTFQTIYTIELLLRVYGNGWWWCVHDSWTVFETFLVICGAVGHWLVPLRTLHSGEEDEATEELNALLILRVMRLLRLVRAVKAFVRVRVLYTLVMGLLDSAATIFYTFVLLFFFLYLFAVLGVEVLQFCRFL